MTDRSDTAATPLALATGTIILQLPRGEARSAVESRLVALTNANRFEVRRHDDQLELVPTEDVLGLSTPVMQISVDEVSRTESMVRWTETRQRLSVKAIGQLGASVGLWIIAIGGLLLPFSLSPTPVLLGAILLSAWLLLAWFRYQKRKNIVSRARLRSAIKVLQQLEAADDHTAYRALAADNDTD